MITWDKPEERLYSSGLDRGVVYLEDRDPIPWNGIQGVDEGGESTTAMLYRDGVVYLADAEASDFTAKLTTLFFPNAISECVGIPEATDGLFVDNQRPTPFGFSYRSLVGSGAKGDLFGYQIHLIYNAVVSINTRTRTTIGESRDPTKFTFDMVATPIKLDGYRPSAHYIIDTRNMSKGKVAEIENLLYGNGVPGRLPTPNELYDMLNYGGKMTFTVHTDGTFTVEGPYSNLTELDAYHFQMDNVNGVDNGDGTYVISDGGDTVVVVE